MLFAKSFEPTLVTFLTAGWWLLRNDHDSLRDFKPVCLRLVAYLAVKSHTAIRIPFHAVCKEFWAKASTMVLADIPRNSQYCRGPA